MTSRIFQAFSIRHFGTQAMRAEANKEIIKGSLQQTHLPNGLLIISLEHLSPVSRFAAFIKAGSKFETASTLGLTHTLRYAAGMSTQNSTIFGITRNMEFMGGSLTASATRDNLFYKLNCLRDFGSINLKYLGDIVSKPAFKQWQLEDYQYRINVEIKRALNDPQILLIEALHQVAFRGGLSNSLYCPEFMLGKHSTETLLEYFDRHFVSEKMAIVGLGVDHKKFVQDVENYFAIKSGKGPDIIKSKFIGGETRISRDTDITMAALATEGVGNDKLINVITSKLLEYIILVEPKVKYSCGSSYLSQAVRKVAQDPFSIQMINFQYDDTGLFGFAVAAKCTEVDKIFKTALLKMREIVKNINEKDFLFAKNQLKTNLCFLNEDPDSLLEMLGEHALNYRQVLSTQELEKLVDQVKFKDVTALASKILKGKGALVSIGNLDKMLYLEDLIQI